MSDPRCKDVFAALSAYLDMELPPEDCHNLEAHLEGCPPCIEFVESLRKTIDLCRDYSPTELPAPLSDQARQELREAYRQTILARAKP
jgi:anti-sigma factor RsiW